MEINWNKLRGANFLATRFKLKKENLKNINVKGMWRRRIKMGK
jgi:hypothetical protein